MKRREFIRLIGGATAWPLAAYAQQPSGPIPQIVYLGALSPTTLDPRQIEQFKAGLAENGLIDGQNIKVDFLWGEGSSERLRQQAADLAQRSLSVIVTAGPQPVRALLEAKVKSPIVFDFHRRQLIELSSRYRLPSIWEGGAYVRDGGLLSYGPSFPDMYRRSAGYVAKIIKGASPSELPVEQPTRFELAINLQTARTLGLAIPATLISRADEVIE